MHPDESCMDEIYIGGVSQLSCPVCSINLHVHVHCNNIRFIHVRVCRQQFLKNCLGIWFVLLALSFSSILVCIMYMYVVEQYVVVQRNSTVTRHS